MKHWAKHLDLEIKSLNGNDHLTCYLLRHRLLVSRSFRTVSYSILVTATDRKSPAMNFGQNSHYEILFSYK